MRGLVVDVEGAEDDEGDEREAAGPGGGVGQARVFLGGFLLEAFLLAEEFVEAGGPLMDLLVGAEADAQDWQRVVAQIEDEVGGGEVGADHEVTFRRAQRGLPAGNGAKGLVVFEEAADVIDAELFGKGGIGFEGRVEEKRPAGFRDGDTEQNLDVVEFVGGHSGRGCSFK